MFRAIFVIGSIFISQFVSAHTNVQQESGNIVLESNEMTSSQECILGVTSKIYVNPERIFCEEEKHYLQVDENKMVFLSDLQHDRKGYFVELNADSQLDEFMFHLVRAKEYIKMECPLCQTGGYIAGICKNANCPGIENRRRYEEERKKKAEDFQKKKQEEKKQSKGKK